MLKGTATEFLANYGWAILIVIVVVCAVYSIGFFTGSGYDWKTQEELCRNLCEIENMTYDSTGVDYCKCYPLPIRCLTVNGTEYCQDVDPQYFVVRYTKKVR